MGKERKKLHHNISQGTWQASEHQHIYPRADTEDAELAGERERDREGVLRRLAPLSLLLLLLLLPLLVVRDAEE